MLARRLHEEIQTHLLLPGYGDGTRAELSIEVDVLCLNFNTLDRRKLLNIEDILGINSMGLKLKLSYR